MRYFKEKETGTILLIDELDKKTIRRMLKNDRYSEWFIYGVQ